MLDDGAARVPVALERRTRQRADLRAVGEEDDSGHRVGWLDDRAKGDRAAQIGVVRGGDDGHRNETLWWHLGGRLRGAERNGTPREEQQRHRRPVAGPGRAGLLTRAGVLSAAGTSVPLAVSAAM